ncbi:hypothetical protein J3Q64DRAFT_1867677 [Phycomyces blakesleeanus]|uniref:Peptidase A1 domain-containing protein n=2 Tax=Phycomyces blakesleeanus TaxID=4837 RepID=A0A167PXN6_PHYB8|nr:hypothetical protein PHYBLDRAFT_62517 [Phycomyces blakesleeanus NRRL 1555(-)]OAD78726.1 hypothetical protein PHYBLDRAFT_62517 [Phycomyces blakesleeanus NRRL 1555(-)]|eukprot:XP_018296766.1 hypothetical protein PHYBLDRAFT_62517 [Phycomyces blakesleeanus NRRL 1555(-)]
MDNLISQGLTSKPIFGVYLGKSGTNDVGDDKKLSIQYVFGGCNSDHINGNLTTVPIDSSDDNLATIFFFTDDIAFNATSLYDTSDNYYSAYSISYDISRFKPGNLLFWGSTFNVPASDLTFEEDSFTCTASFAYVDMDFTFLKVGFIKKNYLIISQEISETHIVPIK